MTPVLAYSGGFTFSSIASSLMPLPRGPAFARGEASGERPTVRVNVVRRLAVGADDGAAAHERVPSDRLHRPAMRASANQALAARVGSADQTPCAVGLRRRVGLGHGAAVAGSGLGLRGPL